MKKIAVASGKGGVGKSTVAVHLTLALAKQGWRCGLLDADIYGPSIPTMLGVTQRPHLEAEKLIPIGVFGIKTLSMGLLATDDMPVIWRGPMVANILGQFLDQVEWGLLDYLIIDLPPGTGDAQLTLTQKTALAGAIIVTTPQDVALLDARRGLKMFQQVNVPVLGIVENMSYFICDSCGSRHDIFRSGGGKKVAEELGLPLLGEIPLDPRVALGGDTAQPMVVAYPDSAVAKTYFALAETVVQVLEQASELTNLKPKQIQKIDERTLKISWTDGHESIYDTTYLRDHCLCAACRDEWTGERKINLAALPKTVLPLAIDTVGHYGLKIRWNDGHATGIYPFVELRKLCQCPACQ